MTVSESQKYLGLLWFIFSGLLLVLMFLQTEFGHYQDPGAAWSWLLPNLLPTLSLMIGVFVAEVVEHDRKADRKVARFVFLLAFGVSALYLVMILAILALQPWGPTDQLAAMKQDQSSWLTPLQGLATATLGAFFVKAKHAKR